MYWIKGIVTEKSGKRLLWAQAALGVSLLTLAACGSSEVAESAGEQAPQTPVAVTATSIAEAEWPETFEAPGTVRARSIATLSSRGMGYIRDLTPREGGHVEAGQIVATLNAPELDVSLRQAEVALDEARSGIPEADSAIASAEAQLNLARITFGRMQDLLEKRSVSQQEFDQAQAQVRVAESAKAMAEARRGQIDQKIRQAQEAIAAVNVQKTYLDVKAPFAGRVTSRRAEPGMLASPGMPLLEIEEDGDYRLEVAVPESHMRSVRLGQTAEVFMDIYGDAPVTGRVVEIVPEVDAATRSFIAKLLIPARPQLQTGLFGRAVFDIGSRQVLTVPSDAVHEQGQLRNVLVVEDGMARSRNVRLGETRDGAVEVLSGLEPDELVITPRPIGLNDGRPVDVDVVAPAAVEQAEVQ